MGSHPQAQIFNLHFYSLSIPSHFCVNYASCSTSTFAQKCKQKNTSSVSLLTANVYCLLKIIASVHRLCIFSGFDMFCARWKYFCAHYHLLRNGLFWLTLVSTDSYIANQSGFSSINDKDLHRYKNLRNLWVCFCLCTHTDYNILVNILNWNDRFISQSQTDLLKMLRLKFKQRAGKLSLNTSVAEGIDSSPIF